MNILVFAGQSDKKLKSKLEPIQNLTFIDQIFLFRNSSFEGEKINCFVPKIKLPFLKEILKFFKAAHIIRTQRIHFILGYYLIPHGILASILGYMFNVKVIQISLGEDAYVLEKYKFLLSPFYKNAYAIGSRGSKTQSIIKRIVHSDSHYFIPHNIYVPTSSDNLPAYVNDPQCFICLTVANFSPAKNIDGLLMTIAHVKKSTHPVKFIMVGGGALPEHIKKTLAKLGIEHMFEHIPQCVDLEKYYTSSHAFILTSVIEGLPMAIIEAMSYGLPVITSNVGDIPDVISHLDNGMIIEDAINSVLFAQAILKLATDKELRMKLSQNALLRSRGLCDEYSSQHIQTVWQQILKDI